MRGSPDLGMPPPSSDTCDQIAFILYTYWRTQDQGRQIAVNSAQAQPTLWIKPVRCKDWRLLCLCRGSRQGRKAQAAGYMTQDAIHKWQRLKAHLDGDILVSLSHNDPDRWRYVIRVLKAVVHSPQGVLHLQWHNQVVKVCVTNAFAIYTLPAMHGLTRARLAYDAMHINRAFTFSGTSFLP